jgi:hypothetical protein
MYKVIVERPRRGGSRARSRPDPVDPEDSPRQEGLRKRHTGRKWLNENLRPLERYLDAQVGRPWDKVHSEICAGIDRRNTVQQHIHQHLDDFVARKVIAIDGVLHEDVGRGRRHPLETYWASRFFVDPGSGLLRRNRLRDKARREYRNGQALVRDEDSQHRLRISSAVQLHRVDGVWYRVELSPITAQAIVDRKVDAIRNLGLQKCPRRTSLKGIPSSLDLYGDADLYASAKRQLNARELRHYRLRNDNA